MKYRVIKDKTDWFHDFEIGEIVTCIRAKRSLEGNYEYANSNGLVQYLPDSYVEEYEKSEVFVVTCP